jgi:outer membrane immunogenic protein
MKKMLFAAAIVTFAAGAAQAADLPSRKEAPVYAPPPPIFSWAGPYAGIHAGAAISDSQFAFNLRANDVAFLGGGTIGYNLQFGPHFVVGVEADAGYRSEYSGVSNGFVTSSRTSDGYLGTVRLRLGYAVGNAIAPRQFAGPGFIGFRSPGETQFLSGWTVGAGLEYGLTDNWSVKAEYLYVRLQDEFPFYNLNGGGIFPVGLQARSAAHVARAGVNYHFNWGVAGPVLAKY